jgi:hypothetical protein
MPYTGVFSLEHLALIKKLYLRQMLPPREVAREINEKFGTAFTPRQISSMLVERGLSKRRKLAKGKAILAANDQLSLGVHQRPELATVRDIVAGHQRLGQKITAKAEHFVDTANSAKTLSSATSAARTGISIVRQACGLDNPGSPVVSGGPVFNFNFAHSPESPFSPEGIERQRLANMKQVEKVAEAVPAEDDRLSVNAESMEVTGQSHE